MVGPEGEKEFDYHWERNNYPFVGIPDPEHRIADLYGQTVNLLKIGRMPAQVFIDKEGRIRHQHFGDSMRDITSIQDSLEIFDKFD